RRPAPAETRLLRPPRPRRLPRRPDHLILRPQHLIPGGSRREIVPIRRGSSRGGTGADGTESAERSRRGLRPVSDVIPASRYVSVGEFGPAAHRSPSLATWHLRRPTPRTTPCSALRPVTLSAAAPLAAGARTSPAAWIW